MEMIPIESVPDEGKLIEITDNKVLAYANSLEKELTNAQNWT